MLRPCAFLSAVVMGLGIGMLSTRAAAQAAQQTERAAFQVLFNRYQTPVTAVFVASVDGTGERRLVSQPGLQYSPSYSYDSGWIVFTSEQDGQADIYRVRPDGTGLEQLTHSPAFDDQAALSPDERTLAFVSTREAGTTDLWLKDLVSGETTNVTNDASGNFRPSWSPDGS